MVVSAGWLFLPADSRVLLGDRLSAARPEYGCVDGIALDRLWGSQRAQEMVEKEV